MKPLVQILKGWIWKPIVFIYKILIMFIEKFWKSPGIPFNIFLLILTASALLFLPQGRDLVIVDTQENPLPFVFSVLGLGIGSWWFSRLAFNAVNGNKDKDHDNWHWIPVVASALWMAFGFGVFIYAKFRENSQLSYILLLLFCTVLVLIYILWRTDGILDKNESGGQVKGWGDLNKRTHYISGIIIVVLMSMLSVLSQWGEGLLPSTSLVMLCFATYIGIVTYIRIVDERIFEIPLLSFIMVVVLLGVGFGGKSFTDRIGNNDVVGDWPRNPKPEGVTLRALSYEYLRWLEAQPDPNNPVMVLVASQGGASRAGAWTGAVLAALDAAEGAPDKAMAARRHIFAINAVSGGALGAAGYVAHVALGTDPKYLVPAMSEFTSRDFLAPTLAALLTTDMIERFTPNSFLLDRASALELSWERGWDESCGKLPQEKVKACKGLMGKGWGALYKPGYPWAPILIVQGASLETGRRILTSRVEFKPNEVDANNFSDPAVCKDDPVDKKLTLAISTGIHNGARFPYVSPAGVVQGAESKCHIVDGGYFDATGVETIRELGAAVRALKDKNGNPLQGINNLKIIYLLIKYDQSEEKDSFQISNEIVGPMLALLYSRDGHSSHIRTTLDQQIVTNKGDQVIETVLKDCIKSSTGKLGKGEFRVPMNWVISENIRKYVDQTASRQLVQEFSHCPNPEPADEIERLLGLLPAPEG